MTVEYAGSGGRPLDCGHGRSSLGVRRRLGQVEQPGGVSLWVRLPFGSASEFAALAGGHGVAIVPGPVMSARGAFDDHLRLPLAREHATLRDGVDRLARAWRDYERSASGSERLQIVV